MTGFHAATAVILMAVDFVLAWGMPAWTRRDLYFAVTVEPSFRISPTGRRILVRYRRWVLAVTVFGLLWALTGWIWESPPLPWLGLAFQGVGLVQAYLRARSATLPHAEPSGMRRVAPLAGAERESLPGGFLAWILPWLLCLGGILLLWWRWDDIPQRFPIHWDLQGNPNGWGHRTPMGTYGNFLAPAFVLGLMDLLAWLIPRVRRVRPGDPREGVFRRRMLLILLITQYFIVVIFLWGSLQPILPPALSGGKPSMVWVILGLTLVFMAWTVWILARSGQGGDALPRPAGIEKVETTGDRLPDECWKWGILYFNPEDPALLVEKRFGLGYTLNFARPGTWLLLGLIIVVPLLLTWIVARSQG